MAQRHTREAGWLQTLLAMVRSPSPRVHAVVGWLAPMVVLIVNMWRIRWYTVDDAFISYRYARNLARGMGLVFNQGEHIEGYTNFGWTLMLAAGIKVGLDPDVMAKVVGGAMACVTLTLVYLLSRRIQPLKTLPCIATWLLASSMPTMGYAVFGLETSAFVAMVLGGIWLMLREVKDPKAFPWSAVAFIAAGLTRPEAPMFMGIPMLLLGRRFFHRQNLIRGGLFTLVIGAHMLWRHSYYGQWLPNTFGAKTGDLSMQIKGGLDYTRDYLNHAGPVVLFAIGGISMGIMRRSREVLTLTAVAAGVMAYILLVGGDWMPYFRFMASVEPMAFVLAGVAIRAVFDTKVPTRMIAIAMFAAFAIIARIDAFEDARRDIRQQDRFWRSSAWASAEFLVQHGRPGEVAVADMGYIAYRTDFPLLDLLGLVDPVISKLPGGYTQKTGKGYVKRVFDKMPVYFVLVGSENGCTHLPFPAQSKLRRHRTFRQNYKVAGTVRHTRNGVWCIFERTY